MTPFSPIQMTYFFTARGTHEYELDSYLYASITNMFRNILPNEHVDLFHNKFLVPYISQPFAATPPPPPCRTT